MRSSRFLQVLLIVLLILEGCGGDSSLPGGGGSAAPTGTLIVRHVLERSVPAAVTHFRFSGRDANGSLVFGPSTLAKAAEIRLVVPVSMVTLQIEYLSGDGTVLGIGTISVQISAGGTAEVTDPDWSVPTELVSLSLTPLDASIATGTTQQFSATGTFKDGSTQDLTGLAAWTSSDPVTASIEASGLAHGLQPGTVTIQATYDEKSSSTGLTVIDTELVSLSLTPLNPTLFPGATVQLTATGTFTDGSAQDMTTQVTWSTDAPAVAGVSPGGLLSGVGPGSTVVRAGWGGIESNMPVNVIPIELVSLELTPLNPILPLCTNPPTVQFTATGVYSDGSRHDITTLVTWQSSDPSVATVDNQGLATGVLPGQAQITAAQAGVTSPAQTLTVTGGNLNYPASTPFATATGPVRITGGDFNGDTFVDLAVLNYNSGSVSILLNDQAGGFGAASSVGAFANPVGIDTGDLNTDTILDLVVADQSNSRMGVLLGNGDGTFGAPSFLAAFFPTWVTLGDMNQDGTLDVVGIDRPNSNITIYRGNGDGTFQARQLYGAGTQPYGVSLGDLNGDGWLDAAVAGYSTNTAVIMLNDGAGGLGAPSSYAAGTLPTTGPAMGDLDGDGDLDVTVSNSQGTFVTLLLNNGDGTFQAPQSLALGNFPAQSLLRDLNCDNLLDLIVPHYNDDNVVLCAGNGDGTFQAPVTLAVNGAQPVFVADFNQDGEQDLAVCSFDTNNVVVFLHGP